MIFTMSNRPEQLIEQLGLKPHPEGGCYKEIFRSSKKVQPQDDRPERDGLTVILFLLYKGQISKWHRVRSDESWHFLEGSPLQLYQVDGEMETVEEKTLGSTAEDDSAVEVVPADSWQAAESTGLYSLVSCTVGPGFDFEDFEMLKDLPGLSDKLTEQLPDFLRFI